MNWNASSDSGIGHGWETKGNLYDGLGNGLPPSDKGQGEYDDYDQWFQTVMPGKDPMATGLDWNTWHGKPYVYPEYYHPTAWLGRQGVAHLESFAREQQEAHLAGQEASPFFLKWSAHRPHSPYDPPARLLNASYARDTFPKIRLCAPDGKTSDPTCWDDRFYGGDGHPEGCGPTTDAWCGHMPENETVVSRHAYYASLEFVDEQVGSILDTLEKTGLINNTFVLWTADHGDGQGTHNHWRKGYPYEFSAHVPLMVRWPDDENLVGGAGSA